MVRFCAGKIFDGIFGIDAGVMRQFGLLLLLLRLIETHIELFAHSAQHRLEVLSHYYYIG